MKLILREACFSGIKSQSKKVEVSDKQKQLNKEANEKIKKGQIKYAEAYENAEDYYK